MKIKDTIYIKNGRIIFRPNKKEFDVTDYVNELVIELEKLKSR